MPSRPFRVFVAGTDTGVGKTQVSCALLSLLADAGQRPVPFKPYESGCANLRRPADALALRKAARSELPLETICVHRYREPLAPGVAAERLGLGLGLGVASRKGPEPFAQVLKTFRAHGSQPLVAEAAGGLRVPLDARHDGLDLIAALRLPVVLVARAGLGTLNHTALSLDALEQRGVRVLAVVLSQATPANARDPQGDPSVEDNAIWIARRHGVRVRGPLPYEPAAARRRALFRDALRPLLALQ